MWDWCIWWPSTKSNSLQTVTTSSTAPPVHTVHVWIIVLLYELWTLRPVVLQGNVLKPLILYSFLLPVFFLYSCIHSFSLSSSSTAVFIPSPCLLPLQLYSFLLVFFLYSCIHSFSLSSSSTAVFIPSSLLPLQLYSFLLVFFLYSCIHSF